MAVPTVMNDLSATASSNSPAGTDTIGTNADDFIRAVSSILRSTNHKGSDIASATTTDIGASAGEFVDVTGTTTITGLGTIGAGITRTVRFTGTLTLTHNATSLILPGANNIRTSNGDIATFRSLGSGNWICTGYMPTSILPNILQSRAGVGAFTAINNISIAATASANALTIAIKDSSGSDNTNTTRGLIPRRHPTASTGTWSVRNIAAAQSITIPSGATLGTVANKPFRIWILWVDDLTDGSLCVVNALDPTNLDVAPITADMDISLLTVASIGTGSDSAQVYYTDGSPTSGFSARVLGYVEYSSGLATPGTWASGPTRIQVWGPDIPLPGNIVQRQLKIDKTAATGTTTLPFDDTIPQNTEGDEYMTLAVAPMGAANLFDIRHRGYYSSSNANGVIGTALFQDSTAGALAAAFWAKDSVANGVASGELRHIMRADTTSATTFKVRAGTTSAGTTTFNGNAGARIFGGVMASTLEIIEIQA